MKSYKEPLPITKEQLCTKYLDLLSLVAFAKLNKSPLWQADQTLITFLWYGGGEGTITLRMQVDHSFKVN